MAVALSDRSFVQNLAGLLIAALIVMMVGIMPASHLTQTDFGTMTSSQMSLVDGTGRIGWTLIGIGIVIAAVGVAAVVTGGVVIVAAAAASSTFGVAAATTAINVGLYGGLAGAGLATIGGVVNYVESQRR